MKGKAMTSSNQQSRQQPRQQSAPETTTAVTPAEEAPEASVSAPEATQAPEATETSQPTPEAPAEAPETPADLEAQMVAAMVAQAKAQLSSISRDVAALDKGAAEVESAVKRYQEAKSDRAVNAVATPLTQLVKYANITAARSAGVAVTDPQHIAIGNDWDHVLGKLEDGDADMLASLVAAAHHLAGKLSTTLETLPVADYVLAATRLQSLADQPYSSVPAVLVNAAAVAVSKWGVAYTSYRQASGMGTGAIGGKRPPVPPAGGSGTGQGPENGVWARGHGGLYFRATCLVCGAIKRAGSNPGSFSHTLREHMASHNGGVTPVAGGAGFADLQLAEARQGLKTIWLDKAADQAEAETAPAWQDTAAWRLERVSVATDDQSTLVDAVIAASYQASQGVAA